MKFTPKNNMLPTQEELVLQNIIYENGDLFNDMLFKKGTLSHDFIAIQSSIDNGNTWIEDEAELPEWIEYFSYDMFLYKVEDISEGVQGQFDRNALTLTISPSSVHDESVILHEMIHLHEFILEHNPSKDSSQENVSKNNSPKLLYHDAIFWCLYTDLKTHITDLDDRIKTHGHILNQENILEQGGAHDILFLLKSFDLDLKKGYNLGTVFGYI